MPILLTHVGVVEMTEHEFTPPTGPTPVGVYETVNGEPVRIHAIDGGLSGRRIFGDVCSHGSWAQFEWSLGGYCNMDGARLRDKPKLLEWWVNVYPDGLSSVQHISLGNAEPCSAFDIIARLHIAQQSDGTFAIEDQKRFDK